MLYVILNETQIDINNNRSKIEYNVYCQSNGSGWFQGNHTRKFILNGATYINETSNISCKSPNAYVPIASGITDYITHNNDGSKTVFFEAVIQGSTYGISAKITGNMTLSTIPRASSISCTTANIGETAVIVINSAVSTWAHNVYATFGDETITVLQAVAGGTHSWTIPTSLYAKIPNAQSLQGILTIDTYNGQTKIGTKSINITVMTNAEKCKPNLSVTVIDDNASVVSITGDKNKLVKYKSTAKVQITTSAKNNATISVKRVNGQTVTANTVSIPNTETNTFTIEVTDSRGYSNTVTVTKTMIDYIPLSINANISRKNPTSSEVLLSFSGNYFNSKIGTTQNALQITWKYKAKNATEYSTTKAITPTITGNTYEITKLSLGALFNYQNSYEIQITAIDKLTTIVTNLTVTQGVPVVNWGKDYFNVNGNIKKNGVDIFKLIYPIGSIYMSINSASPATLFGGTWEQIKDKFLLACGNTYSNGATGGEATHKLTIAEMPSHNHTYNVGNNMTANDTYDRAMSAYPGAVPKALNTSWNGSGQAHNNMPPYIAVYIWKRTA